MCVIAIDLFVFVQYFSVLHDFDYFGFNDLVQIEDCAYVILLIICENQFKVWTFQFSEFLKWISAPECGETNKMIQFFRHQSICILQSLSVLVFIFGLVCLYWYICYINLVNIFGSVLVKTSISVILVRVEMLFVFNLVKCHLKAIIMYLFILLNKKFVSDFHCLNICLQMWYV